MNEMSGDSILQKWLSITDETDRIDAIMYDCDELLCSGKFSLVDEVGKLLDPSVHDEITILSYFVVCHMANVAGKLPSYNKLLEKTADNIRSKGGDVHGMLTGWWDEKERKPLYPEEEN